MGTDLPYMPLYIKDLLVAEEVVCMSNECLGAYVRLLAHNWLEGSLPADEGRLSKLANCGRRWGHIRETVLPLFPSIGGHRLCNPRVGLELQKRREYSQMQSDKAKKSHEKRRAAAVPRHSQPSSSSPSSSDKAMAGKAKACGTEMDWQLVDLIGEVLHKVGGQRIPMDHGDKGFHVMAVSQLPSRYIHRALDAVQDAHENFLSGRAKQVKNPAGYFKQVVKRMAKEEAGVDLDAKEPVA